MHKTNLPVSYKALTRKVKLLARQSAVSGENEEIRPTIPHCQLREIYGNVSHDVGHE